MSENNKNRFTPPLSVAIRPDIQPTIGELGMPVLIDPEPRPLPAGSRGYDPARVCIFPSQHRVNRRVHIRNTLCPSSAGTVEPKQAQGRMRASDEGRRFSRAVKGFSPSGTSFSHLPRPSSAASKAVRRADHFWGTGEVAPLRTWRSVDRTIVARICLAIPGRPAPCIIPEYAKRPAATGAHNQRGPRRSR